MSRVMQSLDVVRAGAHFLVADVRCKTRACGIIPPCLHGKSARATLAAAPTVRILRVTKPARSFAIKG
jgi:hypothetical protein